ncbi:nucleotidyltransferase family protein [Hymenobacter sediminis]|uniref:nucleotidyltransferase family protein n=1 Tax=Hymenobacter sediminis TaxID=2218621 RepID=UPI000DA6572A|nr:nucleotidyltransferase family protein [Hymenobacter sediminis]RPD48351.1 nucleotidyltransferase family protein [Hymenobacter sediminis]
MPAIILLAAGASTRLGRPKQLLRYHGQTLLRRAAETAVAAAAGAAVVVVTGAQHEALLPELAGLPVTAAQCLVWEQGMGASVKCGLAAIEKLEALDKGITLTLCDQPHVTPGLLQKLVATQTATGRPIVACAYAGVQGVPVFFSKAAVPLLRELQNEAGAGQLLKRYPELVATVPFPEGAIDVDTEAQYAALLAGE